MSRILVQWEQELVSRNQSWGVISAVLIALCMSQSKEGNNPRGAAASQPITFQRCWIENHNENCQKRENNKKIKLKSPKETQLFLLQKLLGAITQTPDAPSLALSSPHFPGQAKPAQIHHHLSRGTRPKHFPY